ncbi:hypothetical protein P3T36_002876 [Kitasatospora sp. MAP12-15]|uniref:hypothetical protein n=1 Tax=unclassified Kitasatospora TaxID=2633591 RepID=UPI0024763AD3|nr:hypothetical protein [Kitasatospora sp. MAP12-44]MDH6114055.1 hypothetical protein [Kitasatospora sp. MAP12-44]
MSENAQRDRSTGRPLGLLVGGGGGAPLVQPVALAVAADLVDFRSLARYGIFGDTDYPRYLHRTECQLRAALEQGLEVHLRVLEPLDFADFCAAHGMAPQSPAARVAYAADPELAGEPFRYDGAGLAGLLPELVADHLARVRITAAYQALLDALGSPDGWWELAEELLAYVTAVYLALVKGLGGGCHRLVLRTGTDRASPPRGGAGGGGGEREAATTVELRVEHGALYEPTRGAEAFCVTLAAACAAGLTGELLVHSTRPRGARSGRGRRAGRPGTRERPGTVRGWALADGRLTALDADGVRGLLARQPVGGVGGPVGVAGPVRVRPGFVLPQPAAERGGEAME